LIQFRPGSHIWQLVTTLSFVGEYPMRSLYLIGNERVLKSLIRKLSVSQVIRNSQTGMEIKTRVFSVSGTGKDKTLRLYRGALPILDWIHPNAREYYLTAFKNHHFSGDALHCNRNHRVAETAAMCMAAGIEARPYVLPDLQNESIVMVIPQSSMVMYTARALKQIGEDESSKTMFTRLTGALFGGSICYALYNTRNAEMKWSGMGEFKALHSLTEISRLNTGINQITAAILFCQSEEVALKTLLDSDKNDRYMMRFDSIYRNIYLIPMSEEGIRQLRLFTVSDWKEKLLDRLFDQEDLSFDHGQFEYDACVEGVYVLSHLDGDIARLMRFRESMMWRKMPCEVLCYPHQYRFLKEYLGQLARIKTIDLNVIESELFEQETEGYT